MSSGTGTSRPSRRFSVSFLPSSSLSPRAAKRPASDSDRRAFPSSGKDAGGVSRNGRSFVTGGADHKRQLWNVANLTPTPLSRFILPVLLHGSPATHRVAKRTLTLNIHARFHPSELKGADDAVGSPMLESKAMKRNSWNSRAKPAAHHRWQLAAGRGSSDGAALHYFASLYLPTRDYCISRSVHSKSLPANIRPVFGKKILFSDTRFVSLGDREYPRF